MDIGVRELRHDTARVIAAVQTGERVTLTVRGERIADIVPHTRRSRWLSGESLPEASVADQADPALAVELEALSGRTLDSL